MAAEEEQAIIRGHPKSSVKCSWTGCVCGGAEQNSGEGRKEGRRERRTGG